MRVVCVVLIVATVGCSAAPGSVEEDGRNELFSGVAIENDPSGKDTLNVMFESGALREVARTFAEARGKIKKYSPLFAGISIKFLAVVGVFVGVLAFLVTAALVEAKVAFLVASAFGIQKLLSGGSLNSTSGKIAGFNSSPQQWSSPTAAAGTYPYARSSSIVQDANDLAYKSQIPS